MILTCMHIQLKLLEDDRLTRIYTLNKKYSFENCQQLELKLRKLFHWIAKAPLMQPFSIDGKTAFDD